MKSFIFIFFIVRWRRDFRATWYSLIQRFQQLTFPSPVGLGSKSNMSTIFPVKFCHQGFVGVSYHEDAGVEGFDFFPAALMCLNAYCPPTPPVVALPFKSCETAQSDFIASTVVHSWLSVCESCQKHAEAYLYCTGSHQSSSCRCRSQWQAL